MLPHHFSSRLSFVTKRWQSILKRGPIRMQYDFLALIIDRSQNANLSRPSQPQAFADKNIRRTAHNRGLNGINEKVVGLHMWVLNIGVHSTYTTTRKEYVHKSQPNMTLAYTGAKIWREITQLSSTIRYNTINVLVPTLQNMANCALQCQWMNGITINYEEKAQLNKCNLSARLKAG